MLWGCSWLLGMCKQDDFSQQAERLHIWKLFPILWVEPKPQGQDL